MDPTRLTSDQIDSIQKNVGSALRYIGKLRRRMESENWPPDRIRAETEKAYDALHGLNVHLHYLVVEIHTGQPMYSKPPRLGK